MDKETIKSILLAHGFTIKPGETDLRPYVYAAASAIYEVGWMQGRTGCSELVDALEEIAKWTERWTTPGHPVAKFARKALAAHRKGAQP